MKQINRRGPSQPRWMAAAAVVALVFVACGPANDTSSSEPGDDTASPGPDEGQAECPLPELRPGWLPWLTDGEPVPDPDETLQGPEASVLAWLGDDDAVAEAEVSWWGPVVSVGRLVQPDREPGTDDVFTQVEVRDQLGDLVWVGDPWIGTLAVRWRESPGQCGVYSVDVLMSGDWVPYLGSPFQQGERCGEPQAAEDDEACDQAYSDAMESIVVEIAGSLVDG